jgi:hypothetical protein
MRALLFAACAPAPRPPTYESHHYHVNFIPPPDIPRANMLVKLEIGSGVGFFGVVDALVHHEPAVRIDGVAIVPVPGGATALVSWSR